MRGRLDLVPGRDLVRQDVVRALDRADLPLAHGFGRVDLSLQRLLKGCLGLSLGSRSLSRDKGSLVCCSCRCPRFPCCRLQTVVQDIDVEVASTRGTAVASR